MGKGEVHCSPATRRWRHTDAVTLLTVAATHKETKQFFTLYNTLDDKKVYLEKEVSGGHAHSHEPNLSNELRAPLFSLQVNLLNSIHDNFQQ